MAGTGCREIALLHQSGSVIVALAEMVLAARCALALLTCVIIFDMLLVHGEYLSEVNGTLQH